MNQIYKVSHFYHSLAGYECIIVHQVALDGIDFYTHRERTYTTLMAPNAVVYTQQNI